MLFAFSLALMPLQAALLVYDDFDYSTSPSIAGEAGGIGWNGAWTTGNTAGTDQGSVDRHDFGGMMPIGYTLPIGPNTLNLNAVDAKSAWVNRAVSPLALGTGQTYYTSFAFARIDGSNNGGSEVNTFAFRSGNTTIFSVGVTSTEFLTANLGSSSVTSSDVKINFTGSWTTTGKQLMVSKLVDEGNGKASLYVKLATAETDLSVEPSIWDLSILSVDVSGIIDNLQITIGAYSQTLVLDNFAIGTTFDSVIPEPAAAASLLGCGILVWALARRRR